ncbi:MAG: UbiX family flavin prenyltransferase [Nitrososphaerota archaeon]
MFGGHHSSRFIVAITGASGVIYGKRLLEVLKDKDAEIHLVISRSAEKIIEYELGVSRRDLEKYADYNYSENDLDSPLASGSFKTDGMIIVPCSLKTIAGIASGFSSNLILRAADVTIKEGRKLILVPRETPLSSIHLRNMLELARIGVVILPAMPAFYHKPTSIQDLVDFIVGKILDNLGIEHNLYRRWAQIK